MQNRSAFGKRSSSRRQFLSGCSALTLAATAAPTMVFALPFPRANGTLDTIGFGHFSSQLGTAFRVWPNPEQVVEMVLVEAQQQATNQPEALWAPDAHNEKFS